MSFLSLVLVNLGFAQDRGINPIQLKIGSLDVSSLNLASGGCVQVPILINDPNTSRDLRDISFTLEISDPQNVISGGISTNMLVANGFSPTGAGTGTVGISNPGTNLANSNGTSTPNCSLVFNQATEGSGPALNFAPNTNTFANWAINNNGGGVGRKVGYLIDAVGNGSLGMTTMNTDTLIAVLEIPIIASPGIADITITAVPGMDTNTYTYDDGALLNKVQIQEDFELPEPAVISIGDRIELKLGSVTVAPSSLGSGGCIQVPILMNDPVNMRDMRDLTFTFAISDPSNVISGGIGANMLVANAFAPTGAGSGVAGIRNPGVDLANSNGTSTPSCGAVFNQATEGQGPAIDFPPNVNTFANWFINNNGGGVGNKVGFIIDAVGNGSIGSTVANQDTLLAILEIPIISNPGNAQIVISPVMAPDANSYTYNSVPKRKGGGVQVSEDFILPQPALVNIFDVVDCSGASVTPTNPTWSDPQDGGIGGALSFTFPGTALADQIHITSSDGLDVTIPSAGATTTYAIDTTNDGSPSAGANRTYSVVYEVEFPPASGTYVGGVPCNLSPTWAPASANMVWDPVPVAGQPTTLDATLFNAVYASARYANLTGPNAVNLSLVAPSSGDGTNTLVFNNLLSIASVSGSDVGTYTLSGVGPDGNPFTANLVLVLEPPQIIFNCSSITPVQIGGMASIPLAGNDGVVDFTVIYNGTTYDNLPSGNFDLPNIVGNSSSVTLRANGFDAMGNPIFDEVVCDLDYVAPTCFATQDPTGPVDVGTVVTLSLATTNAVSATINGVPMTPDVDPNTNFNVTWTATHVAVAPATVTAIATNPDGETSSCSWDIEVNCDAGFVSLAQPGQAGICIAGIGGVSYDVYSSDTCSVGNGSPLPADAQLAGTIFISTTGVTTCAPIVVLPDSCYYLACEGTTIILDAYGYRTVPTLKSLGLVVFMGLLMATGLLLKRRQRT